MKELKFSLVVIVGAIVFFACVNQSFATWVVLTIVLGALILVMIRYEILSQKSKLMKEREEKIQDIREKYKLNQKESLDTELFLLTVFGEWFTGRKENISKNYRVVL